MYYKATTFLTLLLLFLCIGCRQPADNEHATINLTVSSDRPLMGSMLTISVQYGSSVPIDRQFTWYIRHRTAYNFHDTLRYIAATENDTVHVAVPEDSTGFINVTCILFTSGYRTEINREVPITGYTPSLHPIYLGSNNGCLGCHTPFVTNWNATAHARAGASRRLRNDWTVQCDECHATGYDPTRSNGGFDELQVSRLDHVGCEACHGAAEYYTVNGEAHTVANGFSGYSVDPSRCLGCHRNEHRMTASSWQSSGHARLPTRAEVMNAGNRDWCASCHQARAAIARLKGDSLTGWQNSAENQFGIGCNVCHAVHDRNTSVRNLRYPPNRLCKICHAPSLDVIFDIAHPAYHPQADLVLHRLSAFPALPAGQIPSHGEHESTNGDCSLCHVYATPWQPGLLPVTDHGMHPRIESCTGCHTGIPLDYIAQSQATVRTLLDTLSSHLLSRASTGDTLAASYRNARWLKDAILRDGSYGIHNRRLISAELNYAISQNR